MPATANATRSFFEKLKTRTSLSPLTNILGSTGLTVSRIGFGGYRAHEFEPEHRQSLRDAILGGVNLIDTSTNYTDGSSERMVGEVTAELISSGQITRDEIVFVTKAGYVQGQNLKTVQLKATQGMPYPDMVEFQADCWHNISPEFLRDQITESLARLKVDSIDVLLLHNPEYFLKSSGSRENYYKRIEKAFEHLESECAAGRIRFYGVSSNTIPEAESKSDFTSLAKLVETAKRVSPKNSHFAVIQFPFNLYEAGAAVVPNNERLTVFEYAKKNGLGVLTNRPFNSFSQGRLVRLASFPTHDEVEVKGNLHTTLGRAIELENRAPGYPKAPQGFQWAHLLRDRLNDLDDVLAWRDALYQQIIPSIRQALNRLTPEQQAWGQDYQSSMQEFLKLVTWDLENLGERKNAMIATHVQTVAPDLASSPTLSRKMLRLYWGFDEISSVLVGMRSSLYVKDVLGTETPLTHEQSLNTLTRLQRHKS